MKVKGKINLIAPTVSGISQSTGNPWTGKDVVIQVLDEGLRYPSTIACHTNDEAVIDALEHCQKGDVIEAEVSTLSKVKGSDDKAWRYNEATIHSFAVLEPKAF